MNRFVSTVALCLAFASSAVAAEEGWTVDFAAAKAAAAKDGKDLFLEFTGSDWCPPCKMLKAKIFDTDAFKADAPKGFILVKLDYPRDKSHQTEGEIAQNKELQKHYEIAGFPTVILADATGRPYAKTVGFPGVGIDEYMKKLAELRKVRETRDAALAEAAKATGAEQAKALDKALAPIDSDLLATVYKPEVDKIIAADADGKAGLKAKYEALLMLPVIGKALEQVQQEGGDLADQIKKIDALIAKFKATGPALQEANFAKAIITYGSDKEAAKAHLEAAVAAAPTTRKADEIRKIIEKVFPAAEKK
jgi:thioredoxin-related protein